MKISGEGPRVAQNVTSTPSVNPIPKKLIQHLFL
jgi:hypothetical protein